MKPPKLTGAVKPSDIFNDGFRKKVREKFGVKKTNFHSLSDILKNPTGKNSNYDNGLERNHN